MTVETTFAIVSMLFVFGMLVQGLSVVALNGALVSCAREAARVGVLELDPAAATQAAIAQGQRCQPNGSTTSTIDGDYLSVDVTRGVRIFGLPRPVQLKASAVAMMEPTW